MIVRGAAGPEAVQLLFIAALGQLGIPAHRVFVVDRDQAFFHHELQSPAQFSRTLVAVTADTSRAFFFSPGTPFAPPALIPWYVQGVTALVADPDGARFTRTPMDDAGVNRTTRTAKFALDDGGGVTGTVRIDYAGQPEIAARTTLARGDTALAAALQATWRAEIPGVEITGLTARNASDPDRNLAIDVTVKAERFGRRADERLLVNPADLTRGDDVWPGNGPRLEPVFFPYARTETDNFTLRIPREWKLDDVPDPVEFRNGAGLYRAIWSFDGESLVYQRTLVLNSALVPVEDYATLRALVDAIEAGDATLVPLARVALRPSERGK